MKKLGITFVLVTFAAVLNTQDCTATLPATAQTEIRNTINHAEFAHELKIQLGDVVYLDLTTEKTVYYVKIGNTISLLEDKAGYIIAAKRLGMETIQIIPDGKIYRTVSLDLNKDNKALKEAIEVKLDEIIVK